MTASTSTSETNPSTLLPLCKECKQPNAWSLMGRRYRFTCGECLHDMEKELMRVWNLACNLS
jgi:hypothetical protein